MGLLYLFISKFGTIGKMIAVKKSGGIASGPKNSLIINLIRSLGCVLISLLFCLFSGFDKMSDLGILFAILSGIANAGLLFSWILCTEKSSLCAVEIFCMIGGILIPLLFTPLLFDGETIGLFQWIGALLLLPAAYCFSYKKSSSGKGLTPSALLLLLLACFSNAGCFLTQKLFTAYGCGSAADFNLLTFLFCGIFLGIMLVPISLTSKSKDSLFKKPKKVKKQLFIYILIAIIMLYIAQYFSTLASGKLQSAYFFPLSYAISMPLTLLSDIIIFNEKLKASSIIALLFVALSITLISI